MLLIWGLLSMNLNVTKAVFINLILLIQHGDYFLCVCVHLLFLFYKSHMCVHITMQTIFLLDLELFRV